MAYQALYRKYRPQTFSDVVGQEHITETLKKELSAKKTVHAYLFTGTRGTGKTSCAKILAKAVNCLDSKNGDPCGECEMCRAISNGEITDIVEIDAASNNSVDNIRELREQVNFAPAAAKYRVYIIDEVHMLTASAFNALLKTLEEPPEHVIFILATTEVHKLPATILSRCQRFDFKRIDTEKICERIQFIAKEENITVSDDAATLIANAADGGMRDALSILDLCASSSSDITEDTVAGVCAMAGNDYLLKLSSYIKERDTKNALLLIDELHNSSVDMLRLLSELTEHFRDLMIVKTVKEGRIPVVCSAKRLKSLKEQAESYDICEIISILDTLQASASGMQNGNRRCEMEMTIIKLCNPQTQSDIKALELRIAALESKSTALPKKETENKPASLPQNDEDIPDVTEYSDEDVPPIDEQDAYPDISDTQSTKEKVNKNTASEDTNEVERWDDILAILKTTCPLIAGVLGGSKAYISGSYLLIDTENSQFRSLVNGATPTYRDAIRNAAKQILGQTYKLGPYKQKNESEEDPLAAFAEKLKNIEIN